MKKLFSLSTLVLCVSLVAVCFLSSCQSNGPVEKNTEPKKTMTKQLRHVVLFKFKEGADPAAIKKAEVAFTELPSKISQIRDFEWGMNNSPEGLEKGFTHCYFLTFDSEEDRAIYLPHPDHKAFGELLDGILDDVLVVDYWNK